MSRIDSYSVSLKGNLQRLKINDRCSLYLRVIINCEKFDLPLGLDWPHHLIDNKANIIKPQKKIDPEWQDHQLIIQNELQKINEVFKIYRIQDIPLSIEQFKKEIKVFDRRNCFLFYLEIKIKERCETREIDERTKRNHISALRGLRKIVKGGKLPFHQVSQKIFIEFKKYYYNTLGEDTIKSRIVIFKTYLRIAKKSGIMIDTQVLDYNIGMRSRRLVWLTNQELVRLINHLPVCKSDNFQKLALQTFLFACFTGLRANDLLRAHHNWVTIANELDFVMQKNSRNKPKRLILPITQIAKSFIPTKTGLFFNLEEQTVNRQIKEVATTLEINKHLSIHVARHTFGSNFIENGGEVTILQQLMGHSYIKDTMIYVHIHEHQKRKQLDKAHEEFMNFKNLQDA